MEGNIEMAKITIMEKFQVARLEVVQITFSIFYRNVAFTILCNTA